MVIGRSGTWIHPLISGDVRVRRYLRALVLCLGLAGAGFGIASAVMAAGNPLSEGVVIKVEPQPDGGTDIYRKQTSGRVVIEHQDPAGQSWFESNEVIGYDGKPVVCPDGEPLRVDVVTPSPEPSSDEIRQAQRGLPDDKRAVYNEYSGEFEVIDSLTKSSRLGDVTISEPLYYKCNAANEPALVPLSEIDPEAAEAARSRMAEDLQKSGGLTGLGSNPAAESQSVAAGRHPVGR